MNYNEMESKNHTIDCLIRRIQLLQERVATIDEDVIVQRRTKQQKLSHSDNWLLRYSFLISLLVPFLTDVDVICLIL